MEEAIKYLTIPVVFSIIIGVVAYCLNMPNTYIIKSIGITKYSKKFAIIIFLIVIFMLIFSILLIIILSDYCIAKQRLKNFFSIFGKDQSWVYYLYIASVIVFCAAWVRISVRFGQRKLNFINDTDKNKTKHYNIYTILFLVVALIIDNILLLVAFYYNENNLYIVAMMVYVYNIICTIIIFSFMNAKLQLSSLKNVTIELKNNRYFSNSKIIHENDKYTCIYYDQRVIHINTSEILLIEEEKPNEN